MKVFASLIIAIVVFLPAKLSQAKLILQSPDIKSGKFLSKKQVFNGFGCRGDNIAPKFTWKGIPAGTKSFALTAYDPDAPTGSGWWHWIVYNIPADIHSLNAQEGGNISAFQQGKNDFGAYEYGGACPPLSDKRHRYIFTIYALNIEALDIPKDSSAALIGYFINQHKIASANITAYYKR